MPVAISNHCKTCGAYGVLEPHKRYRQEEKGLILEAYQERSSTRGIERSHGVCRQTLSAWLKKAERLPPLETTLTPIDPERILVLELVKYGPLSSVKPPKFGSGSIALSRKPAKSLHMPAVIAVKIRAEFLGIAYPLLIKRPLFSGFIGRHIKPLFRVRANNIALWVKNKGNRSCRALE